MSGLFDIGVTILLFILVLGGLVLVHELGHFITARLARVRVLEFGVGFPPRAKSLGRGGVSAADAASYKLRRAEAIARRTGRPRSCWRRSSNHPRSPPAPCTRSTGCRSAAS